LRSPEAYHPQSPIEICSKIQVSVLNHFCLMAAIKCTSCLVFLGCVLTTSCTVEPGLQELLAAVFRDATGRSPSSAILSASESPKMKSPQIIVGNKEGHKGCLLHTVPPYRPASDPEKDIGLPVACLNLIANCFPSVIPCPLQ
jgi:hypothetical protein